MKQTTLNSLYIKFINIFIINIIRDWINQKILGKIILTETVSMHTYMIRKAGIKKRKKKKE